MSPQRQKNPPGYPVWPVLLALLLGAFHLHGALPCNSRGVRAAASQPAQVMVCPACTQSHQPGDLAGVRPCAVAPCVVAGAPQRPPARPPTRLIPHAGDPRAPPPAPVAIV